MTRRREPIETEDTSRPMERSVPIDEANRCHARMGEHDFSMTCRGPEGADFKINRCWFCSRVSPYCQKRIDEWEARRAKETP